MEFALSAHTYLGLGGSTGAKSLFCITGLADCWRPNVETFWSASNEVISFTFGGIGGGDSTTDVSVFWGVQSISTFTGSLPTRTSTT